MWDVDLIVLPFEFEQSVFKIHQEIERVHAKRKLIMAAAKCVPKFTSFLSFPASIDGVMAIFAVDGQGRLADVSFPPEHSPPVVFSTLGLGVRFFEDDETAPSWWHGHGVDGSSVAVVVAAALLCNAWKYTWCCVPELPNRVPWRKMPLTWDGSDTLLRLMSREYNGFSLVAPWFLWNSELEDDRRDAKSLIWESLSRLPDFDWLVTK